MKQFTLSRSLRTAVVILFVLVRMDSQAQLWSLPEPGAKWDSIGVRWVAANPNMNWTITPRTGLRDEYFPYFPNSEYSAKPGWATWSSTVDSVTRVKTSKYFISDYVQGYLEYLPNGYNDPKNASKTYPLIIYFPGCGEMGGGTLFAHLVGGVKRPNFRVGMGRLMASDGGLDHFNGVPRELLWNGDYFSRIPLKTPGKTAPPGGWPTQEAIVMACVISGKDNVCDSYAVPSIFDIGKAIDVAVNVNKANYRVDISRIYVTGMSAGAGISWNSPGELPDLAKKIAAIVPVAAVDNIYANEPTLPTSQRAKNIINGGTNVLVVTNLTDIIRDGNGNITNNIIQNNQRSADQLKNVPGVKPGQVATHFFKYEEQGTSTDRIHDAWRMAYRSRNSPEAYIDNGIFKIRTRSDFYTYTDPVTGEGYTSYEWMITKQNLLLLPVDVIRFTATRVDEGVRVDWVSASELNGEKYILERTSTGTDYTTLREEPIQGNSNVERKYSYIDHNIPQSQYLYYRLSEKEKDGQIRYIGIKKIYIGNTGFEVKLYPTVVSTRATVEIQGIVNDKLNVSVVDAAGRILMQQVIPPRQARTELDLSPLASGVYILKINGEANLSPVRFIKQ